MHENEIFILSDEVLNNVVSKIKDEQWQMIMPVEFQMQGQGSVTLREIINAHAYDDAWVPDMLTGKTMEEIGNDKFKGDLLGNNLKENFRKLVDVACKAAREIDDLDKIVHCSFGDFVARNYFIQITLFRALRAYDIAKVIGVDPTLPEDLVKGLYNELLPVAEEWRSYGVFGPEVLVPENDTLQNKLLGLTGRQPD